MSDSIPLLLDTDIGSDIDDAVALAYLLRQPRCELRGITTVTGDTARRAAIAEILCRAAGRGDKEIPIHAGAADPLLLGPGQPEVPHYNAIRKYPHRLDYPKNYAVHFLRSIIRQHPHQLTLLSIGPLTNIATLFALDPDIPWMLKGFVSMAGTFFRGPDQREWNIRVDPLASSLVYNKHVVPNHLSIGLDVTLQCQLPAAEVRQRFAPSPLNLVLEMAEVWFQTASTITFHDPLAAVALFHPEVCTYAQGGITVPLDPNESTAGCSLFTPSPSGPQRVAQTVSPALFFEHFFRVF